MDRRFILAIFLSMLVLFLFQVWFAPKPPQAPPAGPGDSLAVEEPTPPPSTTPPPTTTQPPTTEPPSIGRDPLDTSFTSVDTTLVEETITVQSALFEAEFTNRGGRVTSWELATYQTPDERPVQIVGSAAELGLSLETERGTVSLDEMMYTVRRERADGGGQRLVFEGSSDTGLRVTKTYTVPTDGYLLGLEVEISGAPGAGYRLTFDGGVPPSEGSHKQFRSGAGALVMVGKDLETLKPDKFKRQPERTVEGNVRWAGVRNKYFLATLVPPPSTSSRVVAHGNNDTGLTGVQVVMPLLSGHAEHEFEVYLGPMEYKRLKALGHGLEQGVDLGWKLFRPISQLLLVLMVWLYQFIPNYGVVIILVAGITKIAFYPLSKSSIRSMKNMQKLQPQVAELKEKYKDDPKRMNQKMMELYKANKVNPLGGCLPILLQMPVFIALYSVLYTSIRLRQAPFFGWITDLSIPDTIATIGSFDLHVLPLVMFVSAIAQQMVTPMTDSRQKMMGYMMPAVMLFIFYSFPAGLNLYWTTNNILQVAQQWSIHREPAAEPVSEAKA